MILKRVEKDNEVKMLIKSSTILASKYNKGTKDLTITFNTGSQYKYPNVKEGDYNRFELSESQGKAFNQYIKPYAFEKLEDIDTAVIHESIDEVKADVEKAIISLMESFVAEGMANDMRFPANGLQSLDNIFIEVEKYKSI